MVSIGIDEGYDILTELNDSGLRTIDLSCGHETAGNLAILRLLTLMDIDFFINNKTVDPIIFAQQVRFILEQTDGIQSADVSGIELTTNGRDVSYGNVCFTTTCETQCNYGELQCPII